MAEIVTTRADVRRSLGRMVRLEYFLRYGGDIQTISLSSTTTPSITSTNLNQDTDFWRGDWAYLNNADEERLILNSSSNGLLTLEYPQTDASTAGDFLEIWGLWPPSDVHQKINMALRSAWRFFPNVVVNEQVIIQEDVTQYGILSSDLNNGSTDLDSPAIAEMLKIWIEQSRNVVTGQITSTDAAAGALIFNDTTNPWTTNAEGDVADSNFFVSFYQGPGQGQIRELTTWDTDGIFTVDTDIDVAVDTNTFYAVWDPSSDQVDWHRLTAARFDQIENPDRLYLTQNYPAAKGLRFRFEYVAQSTDLAVDTDESRVPEEYLVYKALSILYDELVGDNRHDRSSHAGLAEYYDQLAQKFAADEGRQLPGATIWTEVDVGGYGGLSDDADPLAWRR